MNELRHLVEMPSRIVAAEKWAPTPLSRGRGTITAVPYVGGGSGGVEQEKDDSESATQRALCCRPRRKRRGAIDRKRVPARESFLRLERGIPRNAPATSNRDEFHFSVFSP